MIYKSCKWLNPDDSPSTGNIVCFDGVSLDYRGESYENTFVSISDCHQTTRLHKAPDDTDEDFIEKLAILRDEIDYFIEYLKNKRYGGTRGSKDPIF